MDFLKLAQSRHSIRSFTSEKVSQDNILNLLKAAQSAPSAGNCQPWHFFVVYDTSVKTSVADATGKHRAFIITAPVLIVVCADISRNEARYGERGKTFYCIQDTAAAIQNILLCAKDLGLGTCWCGNFNENAVSEVLSLPADRRPVAIIPVGYPENDLPATTSRKPLDEIATFIGANDHLT